MVKIARWRCRLVDPTVFPISKSLIWQMDEALSAVMFADSSSGIWAAEPHRHFKALIPSIPRC